MSNGMTNTQSAGVTTIWIQPVDAGGQLSSESASDRIAEVTRAQLASIAEMIKASCQPLISDLKGADFKPNKIAIEFGVGVEGSAKIPFITSGTLSGNFKVSVEWELGS